MKGIPDIMVPWPYQLLLPAQRLFLPAVLPSPHYPWLWLPQLMVRATPRPTSTTTTRSVDTPVLFPSIGHHLSNLSCGHPSNSHPSFWWHPYCRVQAGAVHHGDDAQAGTAVVWFFPATLALALAWMPDGTGGTTSVTCSYISIDDDDDGEMDISPIL